ncbi:hypothetical protein AMJ87_11335 [candidate division WOR_3 bacterium SM23_60]|uniref:Peptidase S8/S53 domain-containing protein n=1 Tax=candidate division WOR_3 bacterium SM23_60 TaxID=1703780 RepID=A0A0S8GAJ4_UNCW3|nr:MAG: hypothetical protein AMJ87_11335 [candidate division WOR_3 bacterium SM23_60]
MICICALSTALYAQGEKIITSVDDIPRFTYVVSHTITELVTSEEAFEPLARKVRGDIENVLKTYEIEDKTTLKNFLNTLVLLDMLDENYDGALTGLAQVRELQDKPASKLMTGLITGAIISARREAGVADEVVYREVFSRRLSGAIEERPWLVIQDEIEEYKGHVEVLSDNFLRGIIQSQLEPAVEHSGTVSGDIANRIIGMRYMMFVVLPLKDEIVNIYSRYIEQNRVDKDNIWDTREVVLTEEQDCHPVIVAIWDTGVDTDVYPGQLFVNAGETMNGKDDDGNGYIDDIHGIAHTIEQEKTPELLYPMGEAKERISEMHTMIKGFFDMQSAISSPEAAALKQELASIQPDEVNDFFEDMTRYALYCHGTHVAGVAVDGNPFACIMVARFTMDYRTIPEAPTLEMSRKMAQNYREVIEYFKHSGVRVVNMSWGGTLRSTEELLEVHGIGKDAEERARLAREMFDIEKNAMYEAMRNAPGILFVTSAGNENDDAAFEDYYPASFDLPNVLVVGAVDQAGDVTSFTSFGETVDVYANGYEVEGYLPGGERLAASGTSVSSPNATNLAAKLFALEPSLSPMQAVNLIKGAADTGADGECLLIHPKRSVEMLVSYTK